MSVSMKRMLLTAAIVVALGLTGYYFDFGYAGNKRERAMSGIIGAAVGYIAGSFIAGKVIADAPVEEVAPAGGNV
jgi:hypothetical protein